jgi:hypothetical protein
LLLACPSTLTLSSAQPQSTPPTYSQVKEAKETEVAINENRNKYRNVAARGAMLFFLLNSLNKIHAFYQVGRSRI